MKLNLFLFLKKAVSHVSAFYVCQPIVFNLFILIILNLVTVSFYFYLAFTAPDEGEFCLTEMPFCRGSSVEGNISSVEGNISRVEGTLSRVPFFKKKRDTISIQFDQSKENN